MARDCLNWALAGFFTGILIGLLTTIPFPA